MLGEYFTFKPMYVELFERRDNPEANEKLSWLILESQPLYLLSIKYLKLLLHFVWFLVAYCFVLFLFFDCSVHDVSGMSLWPRLYNLMLWPLLAMN